MSKRTKNHFKVNRYNVQKFYQTTNYLSVLTDIDLPICIIEQKKSATLRQVIIENFPVSEDYIRPKSWILNLEIDVPLLSNAQHTKTVEKALLLFSYDTFTVFMIEMKSSIQNRKDSGLYAIREKFEHTIGKIAILLTSYIFPDNEYLDIPIEYKGLVFYNKNGIRLPDYQVENNDLFQVLTNETNRIYIENAVTGKERLEVFFIQNSDISSEKLTFDFLDFFPDEEYNYLAEGTELTLPDIRILP